MNVPRSFSHPVEWDCLDKLVQSYPFHVQNKIRSKIIIDAVELYSKHKLQHHSTSLDDFDDKLTPNLNWDLKTWKGNLKELDTDALKQWQKLIKKRLSLVEEELFRRTL